MIKFKDFTFKINKRRVLGVPTKYETMEDVVQRMNKWVHQAEVEVVNVETLSAPLVRVWYRLN